MSEAADSERYHEGAGGMNILVAEDNEDSRKLLTKQLRAYGHDVRSTVNGQEALEEALKDPPEILVTDILMPEMDGFQLCMEWKLNERLRGIPVVFYTATYTSDEDEKFALSLGADAFVRKPAEAEEFVRVLAEVVEKAGSNLPPPPEVAPVAYSGFLMGYSKRLLTKLVSKVAELESDIAERNRIQDESNLKAQLLDAATDIIIVTELDWTIQYVNEAACLDLGYRRDELLGHDLRDFIPPDFVNRMPLASADGVSILESAHVHRDGTIAPVEVHERITNWGGRRVRLAVVHDITERKKAEERLRESNARLEQVLQGTLGVIEQIVEASDPYTSGHQRRVAELAVAIGRQMGLPEESCISLIRTAAVIHDIGKTTVPSEILSKPGRLSPEEFGLIKTHSQVGYEIIKRANLPDPVAEVVLQHHERLDGSGYPQGLSGDDILPEAQILAVADVVEAMFSHRPYRPALGIDAALNELSAGSGTRYYPDVVAACTAVFREKGFTFAD
jgi:PAS domain S-box-containing protein/putative nucleotidyltransferase with HDIG domain